MPFVFFIAPVFVLFLGGQAYWLYRLARFAGRRIRTRGPRIAAAAAGLAVYLFFFGFNLWWARRDPEPTRMTLRDALLVAPFLWWIFSSTIAFLVVIVIWAVRLPVSGVLWLVRRFSSRPPAEVPPSPARREFLESAASVVAGAPFVAGAYGLLWGRINLQVTRQPIVISKLPTAFHGFRVAQLSDIHIGPFMSEDEIRKYVEMTNELKPDMVALTGDFVTWDGSTAPPVVKALSGFKAPFGVYGCLGNHDAWSDAEDLIAGLFAKAGVRILRQEHQLIQSGADSINLMGIDFANSRGMSAGAGHLSSRNLEGVADLMARDRVNILLSHNPETFDRAAQLGIDLSLAGHTHGGQLALEFISPELAPTRIVTPYVAGHFQKTGGQLYVNRGIGTIAAPMRVGAPPEITIYELVRA